MADEVDGLIEAWTRELPGLDAEPLAVWSRIKRLAELLDAARRDAYARHELQSWEFDVLAALRRAGAPFRLTPGQLLKQTHVTSGTMTTRVDRLVQRGLVEREANPGDGRGVLVRLTDAGRSRVEAAFADLVELERALSGPLTARQREDLPELLGVLLAAHE